MLRKTTAAHLRRVAVLELKGTLVRYPSNVIYLPTGRIVATWRARDLFNIEPKRRKILGRSALEGARNWIY